MRELYGLDQALGDGILHCRYKENGKTENIFTNFHHIRKKFWLNIFNFYKGVIYIYINLHQI